MIYLDNNATTRPSEGAACAVERAVRERWHNPSSVHRPGQDARHEVELARESLAALVRTKPREIVLTSSGTESIDLAIRGVFGALGPGAGLLTTRIEHAAVRELAESLAERGTPVVWAPTDHRGVVDLAALDRLIAAPVRLVSVQWANNETGAIQPVREVHALCRERGVLFHCDGVQWVGKEPVPESGPACDLLSFSAHKFHGPKGCGCLWIRPGVRLRPTLVGSQELGRRGGTECVASIMGAGAAARECVAWLADASARAGLASLRDEFERRVLAGVPGARVNGATGAARLWNTSNIAFPRIEAEALLLLLSERGLCASAGAACSSGSLEPSPVLLAMGVPEHLAHGSLRFSLSRETTREEVERGAELVVRCAKEIGAGMAPPGAAGGPGA